MQYPSFPMPCSYAEFPAHREMAAYLDSYADGFELREFIRFRATVERLELDPGAGWWLTLDDGSVRRYRAVVVAIGLFWCPKVPAHPGAFGGVTIHSHDYRTPEPFEGRRVVVVGAGQSAAEIAVEVSRLAARTFMSVRSRTHVLPRWIGGKPYDTRDIDPLNRIPWRLMNLLNSSACQRRSECGRRLSAPNGAPGSASPGKLRTASGAIRTPTGGCCSLTSGARAQVTREVFDFTHRRPAYRPRGDEVAGRVRSRELAVKCQSLTAPKVLTAAGPEDEPTSFRLLIQNRNRHSGHASESLPIIGASPRLTCSRHLADATLRAIRDEPVEREPQTLSDLRTRLAMNVGSSRRLVEILDATAQPCQ
jgi:Flavin-binding monooxygenase-like